MRLYTVPYAGGYSFTYLKWKPLLAQGIKLHPIELPGRSDASRDRLCSTIEEMAVHCLRHIEADQEPYALFGHSMGAYVVLEVYRALEARGLPLPEHLILSGMKPPHLYENKNHHLLDEASFRTKMLEMGGIPSLLVNEDDFAATLFRLLRNDLRAVELYSWKGELPVFSCDVSLFNSETDIRREHKLEWNRYSRRPCGYYSFRGTHFFVNERTADIVQVINQLLCQEATVIESREGGRR